MSAYFLMHHQNSLSTENNFYSNTNTNSENEQVNKRINCKVVGVTDGDTLTCLTVDKKRIQVRLNQIDAPEKNQAFGTSAKKALAKSVFGKNVQLNTNGKDKYGRIISEVFFNGKNINKAMVVSGYAWAYREYLKDQQYLQFEADARSNHRGLWSQPNPIYPSEFRHGIKKKNMDQIKGKPNVKPTQSLPLSPNTAPAPLKKSESTSNSSCGSKFYCREMVSCEEAQHYLKDCGLSRLDRDGDGIGCESLCN